MDVFAFLKRAPSLAMSIIRDANGAIVILAI